MSQSLGLLEVKGLVGAITAADTMAKAANITVLGIERAKGFAWFTVKVTGQVGAVQSAIEAGSTEMKSLGLFITAKVIPRASNVIFDTFQDDEGKEHRAIASEEIAENAEVEEQLTASDDGTARNTDDHSEIADESIEAKEVATEEEAIASAEVATTSSEVVDQEASKDKETPTTEEGADVSTLSEESLETSHELAHRHEGTVTIVAAPASDTSVTTSLDEDLAQVEKEELPTDKGEEKPKKVKRTRKSKK